MIEVTIEHGNLVDITIGFDEFLGRLKCVVLLRHFSPQAFIR